MDEPLSALDASVRHALQEDLLRWHSTFAGTSVHVTHDGQEAMRMADKIAVLEEGRIAQFASPAEIYERPATRSVARAVGWPPMNFLSRQILGDPSLRCNFPLGDEDTEVGVRAEAFSVVDTADDADDRGGLMVSGKVTRVTRIDGMCHAHIKIGRSTLDAALSRDCQLEAGQTRRFFAAADQLHIFDVKSGRRVGGVGGV
jgi:ABC-type sugar transport system ATPase subunit